MRLDLAERLRCPRPHAPTPLVVVSRRKRERELLEGFAGCPVCQLEVPIVEGHLRFDGVAAGAAAADADQAPDLARLIALLGLGEPEGAVLLTGRYAIVAEALAELTGVGAVVMHATRVWPASELVSAVLGSPSLVPFTDTTFRGAALDASTPIALVADAVRSVAMGGRIVGAAGLLVPAGLKELARDDQEWVAARERSGAIVELRRRT
jgi:hypothetical protein